MNSLETSPSNLPALNNEGSFTVVDSATKEVIDGKYSLDTWAVEPAIGSKEWESVLHISQRDKLVPVESDDSSNIDYMYLPQGEVWRLWDVSKDPDGLKASEFHQKVLELVKHGASAKEIQEAVSELRPRLG